MRYLHKVTAKKDLFLIECYYHEFVGHPEWGTLQLQLSPLLSSLDAAFHHHFPQSKKA